SDYERKVLAKKPVAYWRLGEKRGPTAAGRSGLFVESVEDFLPIRKGLQHVIFSPQLLLADNGILSPVSFENRTHFRQVHRVGWKRLDGEGGSGGEAPRNTPMSPRSGALTSAIPFSGYIKQRIP